MSEELFLKVKSLLYKERRVHLFREESPYEGYIYKVFRSLDDPEAIFSSTSEMLLYDWIKAGKIKPKKRKLPHWF